MTATPRDVEQSIKQCYSTWGTSYYSEYYGADAPYPPVHLDLVRRLVDERKPNRLLDAGCSMPAAADRSICDGRKSQRSSIVRSGTVPELTMTCMRG